nr:hypothetical protein [Tanacetum cinerariifolium]
DEEETRQEEEESFDPIPRTPEGSKDESNDEEDQELRLSEEARIQEEEEADEVYRDVNINQGRGLQVTQNIEDSHVTLTPVHPDGSQESSSVSSFVTSMLNPISDAGVESIFTTTSSPIVSLQTPTPIMTPSIIATITTSRRGLQMTQEVKDSYVTLTLVNPDGQQQSSSVSSQFVTSVLNLTFDVAEVLTQSSHSSKSSYAIATDLSKMELKKILIKKMEGNKSIQRSGEQRNLYKALVKAYESDKIILDTYIETASTSESAFAEEPVQTTCHMEEPSHPEFDTCAEYQPIIRSSQHPEWFSQQQKPPSPDRDWNKTVPAIHGSIQPWISELVKQSNSRSSFNELMDTPLDFSNFLINRLKQYSQNLFKPLPLIPYNRGRRVIPFEYFINNDLGYLCGGASCRIPIIDVTKETGVISPTDLPIMVLSNPGVPLRVTPIQFALLVDVDTKESVVELQADKKPCASGRIFAITEGQAANTS